MWPPAGIAFAALWLAGPRLWLGVWLGAAAVNYSIALSLPAALAIATGNALEGLAAAWLAQKYLTDKRGPFAEPANVFRFFAIALGASVIAATTGTVTLELIESIRGAVLANWLTWWLGDATGIVILCPLIVILASGRKTAWTPARLAELAALIVLLVATTVEVFTGWLLGLGSPPVTFVLMTFVIWSAVRFGEASTLSLCGLIALIAIAATVSGRGPFAGRELNQSLLLQQIFVSTLVAAGLILAARARQLQRLSETLRRANVEMEEMMHLAAHDLQEPLRTVINSADLLQFKHRSSLNADAQELLGFIVSGAARGRQLIQDLLEVAEAGARPLSPERFASGEALDGALRSLGGALSSAGAEVSRDMLPEVRADRRMLQCVFENLVGNALRYRSQAPPRIEVSARQQGRVWIFSVCDNGIGIEPRHRERVFLMFERLGQHDAPGMGSGLTLCKKIVQRHGGRIWIDSGSTGGTSVHFSLPLEEGNNG